MCKFTCIWFIATCFLVSCYASAINNSDGLLRTKRHSGTFSVPATTKLKTNAQACIATWKDDSARGIQSAKTVIRCDTGVRIDMQGSESHNNDRGVAVRFERYAVQYQSFTYSVVHLQEGVAFGQKAIRNAFSESMDYQSHIFFTNGSFKQIQAGDGITYEKRRYPRASTRDTWVHTTKTAIASICRDIDCAAKS